MVELENAIIVTARTDRTFSCRGDDCSDPQPLELNGPLVDRWLWISTTTRFLDETRSPRARGASRSGRSREGNIWCATWAEVRRWWLCTHGRDYERGNVWRALLGAASAFQRRSG